MNTTERRIKRVHVSQVHAGMYIVEEDAPDLTDEAINEDWLAEEQDWQHVVKAMHRADQSKLTLAMYNGEEHVTGWGDGFVWAEYEGDEPVVQEPERD